jgi:hypothetical protein
MQVKTNVKQVRSAGLKVQTSVKAGAYKVRGNPGT